MSFVSSKVQIKKALWDGKIPVNVFAWEHLRSYKSIQDHIKAWKTTYTKTFIPIIPFFNQKKIVNNGYYENKCFGLVQDLIEVWKTT